MQFLLSAMRKNARRLQLQQWLLLAVRTLIIALVVLAAAEPYGEQLAAGGTAAHKVLVIDGSYSMAYRDDGASGFSRAKQLAAALVRESRSADSFTVILMATPARTILGREVVDRTKVAAEIESLTQPHTGADLTGTLTLVQEALSSETTQRNSVNRHEVYFFTDLQRSTWDTPVSHASRTNPIPSRSGGAEPIPTARSVDESRSHEERGNKDGVADHIAALARQAALAVIDVGQPRAANLAVTRLTTPDPFVTVNREVTFHVALRQFADKPRAQCSVELLVDDTPVGEQTVDVPAGGDAAVSFTHRFQSPGNHTVSVRAAADGLTLDDARWLVVPVREEVRVLCVAGRHDAAKYVADALNPNPAGNSPIRPIVVSESVLAELELSDFDCLFLCNVAQLTSSEAERLRRYAENGGGVVFFLGDRVVPESYNALAGDNQALLPARLGELISQPQFGVDPLDYRHPIVAPFRGSERAGLLTTPVSRYYRLDLPSDRPDVEVAAALPNGDPFMVTAPFGRGRTVLVATAGSLASVDATTGEPWTGWPTWPSFLPIVRELLAHAAGGRQHPWQQLAGTPLASRGVLAPQIVSETNPSALQIVRPDGRTAAVSMHSAAAGWQWSYAQTDVSGIYSLRGLPQGEVQQFAVNVDAAESDLAKVNPRRLPSELAVLDTWQRQTEDGIGTQMSRAGWSQSLLWVALAMLLVEAFLAWKFGRGVA